MTKKLVAFFISLFSFLGKTTLGIHHDDFIFKMNKQYIKDYGSEGQQKNAIIAYKLSELDIFYKLHILRKHTKNCNLESEQKKMLEIIYFILSMTTRIKYNIKKIKDNRKIKKQEKNYKKYIKEHQDNIKKAFEEIKENPIIYQRYSGEILDAL